MRSFGVWRFVGILYVDAVITGSRGRPPRPGEFLKAENEFQRDGKADVVFVFSRPRAQLLYGITSTRPDSGKSEFVFSRGTLAETGNADGAKFVLAERMGQADVFCMKVFTEGVQSAGQTKTGIQQGKAGGLQLDFEKVKKLLLKGSYDKWNGNRLSYEIAPSEPACGLSDPPEVCGPYFMVARDLRTSKLDLQLKFVLSCSQRYHCLQLLAVQMFIPTARKKQMTKVKMKLR